MKSHVVPWEGKQEYVLDHQPSLMILNEWEGGTWTINIGTYTYALASYAK